MKKNNLCIILFIGLTINSCQLSQRSSTIDKNSGYDEKYLEVIIDEVEIVNDSLIMNLKYVNNGKEIIFIPIGYLHFRIFFNGIEANCDYRIISKEIYPVITKINYKKIDVDICLSFLDTSEFIILNDSLNIKYNLCKIKCVEKKQIESKITGAVYASEQLKQFCPFIFTGSKQLKYP